MRPIVLAASALCLTCSGPSLAGAALQGSTPAVVAKASPADELEPGEGRRVAGALADQLLASFAIPDHARDYAAMLRTRAASGRYDKGPRAELARMLTDDLQAVHKDGHLRVMLAQPDSAPGSGGEGPGRGFPPLIQSAKTIAPGVGYIRFSAFLGGKEELAGVARWLSENETARTLIFDLRNHHGGGLAEQDLIFATLFAKPTPLVKMSVAKTVVDEGGFPFKASPTLAIEQVGGQMVATHSAVPGKASPLREAKVYLLVSNRTASAAEHFALAQRHTGILTLGINTDDRPIGGQEIGNDRADTLARARRGNGDKMGRAVITEQSAKGIAPDQQVALVLRQRVHIGARSELRGAKCIVRAGEPDL